MFEVRARLTKAEFDAVENLIFESEGMERWNLYENFDDKGYWVQGVFETASEAESGKALFESRMPIEAELVVAELEDRDWKESYKDHFQPWSIGELHWAPLWLKGGYPVPEGHEVVWLDPGMAFGTGNHATTRLCVEQLIAFKNSRSERETARVFDAGCGSGILAVSAAKLGLRRVEGFDVDEDAVRIAKENAALNKIGNVAFSVCGLEEGLVAGKADCLLANILANVLVANGQRLVESLAPGGWLILSGILGSEAEEVRAHFENIGDWSSVEVRKRDEWASVTLIRV